MNYRMIVYFLGQICKVAACLLLLPLIVGLLYKESTYLCYLLPAVVAAVFGFALTWKKPSDRSFYAREGFVVVALTWLTLSLIGAFPFFLSGYIPSFVDCFFETVSGFTTTGSSILTDIEALPKSLLFWRSFTHWIGGMGVLVFVLAIIPKIDTGSIHLIRAEMTGPSVGKLVSKTRNTALIFYGIYLALTVLEILLLLCGGMPLYDSLVNAFGTAGTGGFSVLNSSIAGYQSAYAEVVIGIFMILFGINFNLFCFLLIGKFKNFFKNEELWWYLGIITVAIVCITINISSLYSSLPHALRDAFFQVSSIITTTGFITANYDTWPMFSQVILVLLMFCGACAGSTGGGLKISRIVILIKSGWREIRHLIHPRSVVSVKLDKKPVDTVVLRGVQAFFVTYMLVLVSSILLLSLENFDLTTTSTAVFACINNIGPGLGKVVGATGNFSAFSPFGKLLLSFDMLAGRLEIFPMLILFAPHTWKK